MYKKVMNKCLNAKNIFWMLVGMQFVIILIHNIMTGYSGDDYSYMNGNGSLAEILHNEYLQYMSWTGRSVAHFIDRVFLAFPKGIFNLFNSCIYVSVTLLVYKYLPLKKYRPELYIFIMGTFWFAIPEFGEAVLWTTGACNYLWGTFWILLACYPFVRYAQGLKSECELSMFQIIVQVLISFIAGWCNENTSAGCILIMVFYIVYYVIEKKKHKIWMFLSLLASIAGFLIMILAPGNAIRTQSIIEDGMAVSFFYRISYLTYMIEEHWKYGLIIFTILGFYFYYKKQRKKIIIPVAYLMIALATVYALIASPVISKRALFGASVFAIIALGQLVAEVYIQNEHRMKLVTLIVVLAWYYVFSLFSESVVAVKRYLAYSEQVQVVEEALKNGVVDVVVPRMGNSSIYSGFIDVLSEDPEYWANQEFLEGYIELESVRISAE